jgi:hypothetical protein
MSVSVSASIKTRRRDLGVSSGILIRFGVASGASFLLGGTDVRFGICALGAIAQRARIATSEIATAAACMSC